MRGDHPLYLVAVSLAWLAMLGATGAALAWGIVHVITGGSL